MNPDKLIFCVSTPGKVILFGEHSVVYGKPALAASTGISNYLLFEEELYTEMAIFKFAIFPKAIYFHIDQINCLLIKIRKHFETHSITKLPEEIDLSGLMPIIQEFLMESNQLSNDDIEDVIHKTLTAVFCLLAGILIYNNCTKLINGFTIKLTADIPMGAGLGSSASFGVIIASAFLFYTMYLTDPNVFREFRIVSETNKLIKQKISSWAFCSEKIMHGKPSGMDNSICTFGGYLKFTKGMPAEKRYLTRMQLLLVDTGVSRSTIKLVEKVAKFKDEHPKLVNSIFDAMAAIVDDVIRILNCDCDLDEGEPLPLIHFNTIGNLFTINNNLLRSIGVSHPSLEEIFRICEDNGFYSKLTGAGGGGFAIVLLPDDYKEKDNFQKMCTALTDKKFKYFEIIIGSEAGVQVEEDIEKYKEMLMNM